MKVICAGLSKTGTTSLAKALRILGFTVYDWPEHSSIHCDEWLDIYYRGKVPDFASMYEGIDAVTDLPAAFWIEEIYEAFPDAKVVLNIRDNEDVWARSWEKERKMDNDLNGCWFLTRMLLKWWLYRKYYALIDATDSAALGSLNPKSTVLFKKKYREHNERVQAVVRKENLLIYNVNQGWKPLCEFLGCDIPKVEPFPRQNVGLSHPLARLEKRQKELRFKIILIFAPLCVFLSAFYLLCLRI